MVFRLSGAMFRALLIMILVATPAMLLADVSTDTRQIVALVALFLGILTFVEYASVLPSLVEFRHAAPYNRLRFMSVFVAVFAMSITLRGDAVLPPTVGLISDVGKSLGALVDFSWSPMRLVLDVTPPETAQVLVTAWGISHFAALAMLAIFGAMLVLGSWPSRSGFPVCLNLPTFDPNIGENVAEQLERACKINVALGIILPFCIPALVRVASTEFAALDLGNPQSLIWTMAAWSFVPASLVMRGIAMGRVATLVRTQQAEIRARESSVVPI